MLTKQALLDAIKRNNYGYYPFSSQDTFELLRCETSRYEVFRTPLEYSQSLTHFAAETYLRLHGQPSAADIDRIEVSLAEYEDIQYHLKWLDGTDEPGSLKFKEYALRDVMPLEDAYVIKGSDNYSELIVAQSANFFVYLFWFTTG